MRALQTSAKARRWKGNWDEEHPRPKLSLYPVATNIRETFRRVRREQRERKEVAVLIEQANREGNALVASVLNFPNKTEK